jgi:anti-sigma-K factor RskA
MSEIHFPDDERLEALLGAYALDAVDDDERRLVDELLRVDPRAAREVDEHRETVAALAWSMTPAPTGLWDKIAASLEESPPAPSGELARVMPIDAAAAKRRRRINALGAAAIGVAAALVVVLAVGVLRRDSTTTSMRDAMEQALDSSDARQVAMRSEDGSVETQAVLDGQGHGFVSADSLPQLPSDRTYQLWGMIDGRAISLGVLGHRPGVAPFSAEGNLTALVITNEIAGGVPTDGNPVGAVSGAVG